MKSSVEKQLKITWKRVCFGLKKNNSEWHLHCLEWNCFFESKLIKRKVPGVSLWGMSLSKEKTLSHWPLQEPKLEVPTIYKAYIRPQSDPFPITVRVPVAAPARSRSRPPRPDRPRRPPCRRFGWQRRPWTSPGYLRAEVSRLVLKAHYYGCNNNYLTIVMGLNRVD